MQRHKELCNESIVPSFHLELLYRCVPIGPNHRNHLQYLDIQHLKKRLNSHKLQQIEVNCRFRNTNDYSLLQIR